MQFVDETQAYIQYLSFGSMQIAIVINLVQIRTLFELQNCKEIALIERISMNFHNNRENLRKNKRMFEYLYFITSMYVLLVSNNSDLDPLRL